MQDVPFEDLTDDDIAFLSGETGIDAGWIEWLADAAKRSRELAEIRRASSPSRPKRSTASSARTSRPTGRDSADAARHAPRGPGSRGHGEHRPPGRASSSRRSWTLLQSLQVDATLAPSAEDEPPSMGDLLGALPDGSTAGTGGRRSRPPPARAGSEHSVRSTSTSSSSATS